MHFTWSVYFHLTVLALFGHAQEIPSVVSLLLGGATPSPSNAVHASAFSWCIGQASFVASIMSSNYPSWGPKQVEAVAYGVCTGYSCTSVGFSRLDECCPIAQSEYAEAKGGTGTLAAQCFSSFKGVVQSQPVSTSASVTSASSSGTNRIIVSSSATSMAKGSQAGSSPTETPGSTASNLPSASTSAPKSDSRRSQVIDLLLSSTLAFLVFFATYIL